MQIIVLEDNEDRRMVMRDCLEDRFPQYKPQFFGSATEMLAFLRRVVHTEFMLIVLDHDLEMLPGDDGGLVDPGTGRDVADYLATQTPVCPIVIHTTNESAGVAMQSLLEDAGWSVTRVVPYGGTDWIRQTWFRAVRDAIVNSVCVADSGQPAAIGKP
jgi:CheY-like chemotaxis protein